MDINNNDNQIEISITQLIHTLRLKLKYLILTGLIFAIVTFVYFEFIKNDIYQSEGTLIFNFNQPALTEYGEYSPISSNINDYLDLFDDNHIGVKTLEDLELDNELTLGVLNSNLMLIYESNSEKQSVKVKFTHQNQNCSKILYKYLENYIKILNSKLSLDALNYFNNQFVAQISLYETRNGEIQKEIKQIEELMNNINKSIPKEQLDNLKNEGILINLSDVLNSNYILLEEDLIQSKRQLFNYQVKIDTYQQYLDQIKNQKASISKDKFTLPIMNTTGGRVLVLSTFIETSESPMTKGTLLKSFIALFLGFVLSLVYYFYRFVISKSSANNEN